MLDSYTYMTSRSFTGWRFHTGFVMMKYGEHECFEDNWDTRSYPSKKHKNTRPAVFYYADHVLFWRTKKGVVIKVESKYAGRRIQEEDVPKEDEIQISSEGQEILNQYTWIKPKKTENI